MQINKKVKRKTLTLLILLMTLVIFSVNANASVLSSLFGGGGSSDTSGTASNPYELIVNGTTRNNDEPNTYYKFYSAVDQNITVHISDHGESRLIINRDLSLKLYTTDSNNTCTSDEIRQNTAQDGNFDWLAGSVNGGNFYCLSVEGSSSSNSYDINITGDSALKAAISDASANEDDNNITFLIGLTHAAPSDTTISYTFYDHTARNGVNYNGINSTVTIPVGQDSATITVGLIDTNMSTTKDFTVSISSSSVEIDDANATGTIIGSASVSGGGDYHGPDICYSSREQSGFCMFGSCMFYKETTHIKAMVEGLSDIDIKKALTRGIAFLDFASDIGIDGNSKTMKSGDDQAEKRSFISADFLNSSFFNASMFPEGLEYRIGTGANSSQGGSLDENGTASYYDKSLFKFGFFTQYTHIVTYKKNNTEYQEVLQACNPDSSGSLEPRPSISQCGMFLDALNSKTKITFNTSSRIYQTINNTTDHKLNTPEIQNTNNTALCSTQPCQADGIGSHSITLPTFRDSTETDTVNIPYSMVIADQQVGSLITTNDSHTESSENNRTIVFEAPYSPSYGARVMFIHSITDHDAHADTYHYVFKEGDYWINSWDINKNKNVTIETVGNVRFFINGNFTITNSGALKIGHGGDASSPKFYMYIYGNFATNVTGATAIQNGYIYTKGTLTLGSTSTITLDNGALTADGELTIQNGASSTFNYTAGNSILFEGCSGGITTYTTGPFDAWDTFRSINDRNISTKIVNQDFNLTIASLNSNNDATEAKNGINMQYQLYDIDSNMSLTPWQDYNATLGSDGAFAIKPFQINSARKNVRVRFRFCGYNNGSGLVLDSLNTCDSNSSDYNNSYELNTSTYSSDNFAVRPFAFKIFGNNQYKRAGEDFNLTVKAVDENNYSITTGTIDNINGVINYNQPISDLNITSHFYISSTSDIHQMKTDTGQTNVTTCPYSGSFTVNDTNFSNGETNATLNFSETGILDINISEKAGYEFAKVDEDDTNNSQRYIKPAIKIYDQNDISKTNILLFVPYSFTTTAQYNTTNQKNWVYMADIKNSNISFTAPKMAAYVFYTIKAYNKFGNLTKNFTKTCFPDVSVNCPTVNGLKLNATFDLFLDLDINSTKDANITLYSETNTSTPIYTPNKNISILKGKNSLQEWISPKQFKSGVGQAKVYLNIDRNISTSLNPIIINVQDANTSTSWMANPGSPVAFNGIFLDTNKTFFYGRVHAPDYSAENNTTISDAKIYYEVYCKDCGKSQYPSLGKESVDGVYWYINTAQDNSKDGNISGFPNFLNTTPSGYLTITPKNTSSGVEDYVITYTGSSYPYKEDINISASKWFIYNPYNSNATTDNFYVDFLGIGGWAGIGNTGKTVDLNISTRRSKRLEW